MPLELRVPLALLVVLAAGAAVGAPAPSARVRSLWLRPALAGLLAACVWTAVALEAGGDVAMRGLLCAASLLLALSVWLLRGEDPPREDDDDEGNPPSPGPEIDWDRWERELDRGPQPVA